METPVELHVLTNGQVAVQRQMLLHDTDETLHLLGFLDYVEALDPRGTRGGSGQSCEHTNCCGFSCAVRSQETEDFAVMHL